MIGHSTPTVLLPHRRRVAVIDPQITYMLVGALIPAVGWAGKEFWKSLKESRQGRKAEADRIADERDNFRRKKAYWKNKHDELRAVTLALGLTREQLDQIPPYPDDK